MIPFRSMTEYHPISAKDQSRHHLFGTKVLPVVFLGYVLHVEGIWKGDIMVADIEELENLDASAIHARRLDANEVFMSKNCGKIIFLVADGTVKLSGRDQVF